MTESIDKNWWVYMIRCSDESLYTGITTDMDRRFAQHSTGRGAKYFRGRRPIAVVYLEGEHTRSTASRREIELKSLNAAQKRALLTEQNKIKGLVSEDDNARG